MPTSEQVSSTIAEIIRDTLRQIEASTDERKDTPAIIELRLQLLRMLREMETPKGTDPPHSPNTR
ncbi:MAG: hypothetical protein ABSE36_18130 [Terracidiphilus sp.]|jgi:hypothetical protein